MGFILKSFGYCGYLGLTNLLTKTHPDQLQCCLVTKSYPTLCNPMDCSPPGSSVHEISQARILERVAISFSRGSSQPRNRTHISCLAGRFFTTEPPGRQLEGSCAVSCKWFSFYMCLVLSNTKKNL